MIVIVKRPGVLMGVRSGQDTVAVRLGIGHGRSAYPSPIKATQPSEVVRLMLEPDWTVKLCHSHILRDLFGIRISAILPPLEFG